MPNTFQMWVEVLTDPQFIGLVLLAVAAIVLLVIDRRHPKEDPIAQIINDINRADRWQKEKE